MYILALQELRSQTKKKTKTEGEPLQTANYKMNYKTVSTVRSYVFYILWILTPRTSFCLAKHLLNA